MRKTKAENSTDFVSYSNQLFGLASKYPIPVLSNGRLTRVRIVLLFLDQRIQNERGKAKAYAKKGKKKIRTFK